MKLLSTLLLLLTLASCGSGGGSSSSEPNTPEPNIPTTPVPTPPVNPASLCHPYKEIIKYVAVNSKRTSWTRMWWKY